MVAAGDVLRLRNGAKYNVFVDFDGMVAPDDATDSLLARYADPSWRDLEVEWQQGRLTAQQCMSQQVELLRMTPGDLFEFVKQVTVDPDFASFVAFCRAHGAYLAVVSDGMDYLVASVLRRAGLSDVPFFANTLEWQGGDRWKLRFPHFRPLCRWNMGNCKCGHLRPASGLNIMVGDGRSDFCVAEACDFTLAKGTLGVRCREVGLPHAGIANFAEALDALTAWLRQPETRNQPPAAVLEDSPRSAP
jgi:2-hydroxy-3-keto-5-methylthiopentenyl-1-phosphate phosphatase